MASFQEPNKENQRGQSIIQVVEQDHSGHGGSRTVLVGGADKRRDGTVGGL